MMMQKPKPIKKNEVKNKASTENVSTQEATTVGAQPATSISTAKETQQPDHISTADALSTYHNIEALLSTTHEKSYVQYASKEQLIASAVSQEADNTVLQIEQPEPSAPPFEETTTLQQPIFTLLTVLQSKNTEEKTKYLSDIAKKYYDRLRSSNNVQAQNGDFIFEGNIYPEVKENELLFTFELLKESEKSRQIKRLNAFLKKPHFTSLLRDINALVSCIEKDLDLFFTLFKIHLQEFIQNASPENLMRFLSKFSLPQQQELIKTYIQLVSTLFTSKEWQSGQEITKSFFTQKTPDSNLKENYQKILELPHGALLVAYTLWELNNASKSSDLKVHLERIFEHEAPERSFLFKLKDNLSYLNWDFLTKDLADLYEKNFSEKGFFNNRGNKEKFYKALLDEPGMAFAALQFLPTEVYERSEYDNNTRYSVTESGISKKEVENCRKFKEIPIADYKGTFRAYLQAMDLTKLYVDSHLQDFPLPQPSTTPFAAANSSGQQLRHPPMRP